jgi:hypothetical protein
VRRFRDIDKDIENLLNILKPKKDSKILKTNNSVLI